MTNPPQPSDRPDPAQAQTTVGTAGHGEAAIPAGGGPEAPKEPAPEADRAGGPLDVLKEPRTVFVQMLFSLAAGEVARQFARLVTQEGWSWEVAPAYAHLLLAGIVIATSWVGWTTSAANRQLRVERVFSLPFLVLLVDVGLVFLYFLLTQGAEVPPSDRKVDATSLNAARTLNAVRAVCLIFIGYFVWDLLTKKPISRLIDRALSSLICMLLAITAWVFLRRNVVTPGGVLLVEGALLALVLLFRAWKQELKVLAGLLFVAALVLGVFAWWFGSSGS